MKNNDEIKKLKKKLLREKRKNEELELKLKYLKEEKKLFWKVPKKN